ncbi:MAG: hypothetical protein ACO28V_09510, partial [Chitinophagaceae bacterium]
IGEIAHESLLPSSTIAGTSYLIKESSTDIGKIYFWTGTQYESFVPEYGWSVYDETPKTHNCVSSLINNQTFIPSGMSLPVSREVDSLSGVRLVVKTMNKIDSTFDLIEISPRLVADISDMTLDYSVTKSASDLGISGMPVGQLLASVGSINLFDVDEAFSPLNTNSLVSGFDANNNIQIKFFETALAVNDYDYTIPIKTLYSENLPSVNSSTRQVSISLRDAFFYFESTISPEFFLQNVSLSYAISTLLDGIGFSNYVFKRLPTEKDPVIANFIVGPNQTIAKILNDLAVSTQSAMFFDEYNNLIVMTKDYMLASEENRPAVATLSSQSILEISSQDTKVFNNGKINYSERSIQKSYGSIRQSSLLDSEKTWIYKPALLWEVSGTNNTKSMNGVVSQQSAYTLSAIPLNTTLSSDVPQVKNNTIVNNTIDLGEGIYWITRNNGYFYANGEVIKYDAVQYSVPGVSGQSNVWIKDEQEYANYFSKLPFNAKIFPTGLIRIYAEPNYEVVDGKTQYLNGAVAKHGRGQFGTKIVDHQAGLSEHWRNNANIKGCQMNFSALFSDADVPATKLGAAGVTDIANKTTRNGIIRNFMSSSNLSESSINELTATQSATIQSSALVMTGPAFTTTENPVDYVSYVYKPMSSKFKHFGTRMRIIGRVENNETQDQSPFGGSSYFSINGATANESVKVGGASGGLALLINPQTNNGYYFEIAALTQNSFSSSSKTNNIYNVLFYKVKRNNSATTDKDIAVPIRLWAG